MDFNLLQYPSLASQRRQFHRRWTSTSGVLVGTLVAVGLAGWVQEKQQQGLQERALLESRLKRLELQRVTDQALLIQQRTWQQQAAHVQALRSEQQRWEALHEALLQEAGPQTVQLLRLQLDAQSLELHGRARDVQRMAQSRERLSLPLVTPEQEGAWSLISVVNAPRTESMAQPAPLEFAWQTAWARPDPGLVAVSPARSPVPAGSPKEHP